MLEVLNSVSPEDAEDLNKLAQQITPGCPERPIAGWEYLTNQLGLALVVYRNPETKRIVGMGSVIVQTIPTRTKAYIEDVVTDESHRKRGIGRAIEGKLLEIARNTGAPVVYLTSSRPDAQAMWTALNWDIGKTTPYAKKSG